MLSLTNVSTGYNGTIVVKDISFSLCQNENLSIIGPNGCGKTTLLKAVANILPFSGNIEIQGMPVSKMKHKEVSLKIALLAQMSGVYFSYSVFDTVMMGRYLHIKDKLLGLPSEQDREIVLQCLDAVDLLSVKDKMITTLSGGQLQRVFLARTLVQQPEIILLDEPTNHLDLKYQIELVEYLKEWAMAGNRLVIGVMHDINLAMKLSDNIMVMKEGKIQVHGKVNDVITNELLESVYDIDVAEYMLESLQRWETISARNGK